MKHRIKLRTNTMKLFPLEIIGIIIFSSLFLFDCSTKKPSKEMKIPKKIVDLGALITEDLPERVWGKGFMTSRGYSRSNNFEVINWNFENDRGRAKGSNAYYTLFNHGGPHVDAPNHSGLGNGIDSYPIEVFIGPLKVFDVRRFPKSRSIPIDVFKGFVNPGDIVLIYTGYTPPQNDEAFPETITLTRETSEYLANIPVRAYGTDAFSVANLQDTTPVVAETETARVLPIHHSFLSRGIPIYEQLFNIEDLLNIENMYFIGVPLNIKDGDGMLVRPIVMVY